MTKDSLKRKIKEEGLAGSVLYYLGRFCSKAELAVKRDIEALVMRREF